MRDHLKLVFVGHVDHGKSTLIGRLLYDTDSLPEEKIEEVQKTCESLGRGMEFGFVMDHLEEERSQGITIDTAQTFFRTGVRRYVIIDAPGHKEFIKNMITGASQADAAVLVVDATEGVKEQTKRHAYLLGMLGIHQVAAVVNKMDLVGYSAERFDSLKSELEALLHSMSIPPRCTIPISARDGDNAAVRSEKMPWYAGPTLLDALDSFFPGEFVPERVVRFPVQDVYKVNDKRILVGRLEAGSLHKGDEITFHPQNRRTTVRSIEVLWKDKTEAQAGESIGITLKDPLFVERGAVACLGDDRPGVASSIKASVFWMSARPLRSGEKLLLRVATQEVPACMKIGRKIDSSSLEVITENPDLLQETEVAELWISTERPVAVERFDDIRELGRFVLVRDADVVAGGIILDADG